MEDWEFQHYIISDWWFQAPWKIVRLDHHPNYWAKSKPCSKPPSSYPFVLKNSPGLEKNKKLIQSWLVVLTILKNISQWGGLSHILWKIKNVPNHQPESVMFITAVPVDWVLRSATVNTIWWNTPDEMFPGSSQIIPRSSRKSAFKLKKHQSLASGKRLQQNYVFFVGNWVIYSDFWWDL